MATDDLIRESVADRAAFQAWHDAPYHAIARHDDIHECWLQVREVIQAGRWSLALDLMEPFRPVLVEALALDCFSHQILDATCFEPKRGACT